MRRTVQGSQRPFFLDILARSLTYAYREDGDGEHRQYDGCSLCRSRLGLSTSC